MLDELAAWAREHSIGFEAFQRMADELIEGPDYWGNDFPRLFRALFPEAPAAGNDWWSFNEKGERVNKVRR
jgi:hypothetical protein